MHAEGGAREAVVVGQDGDALCVLVRVVEAHLAKRGFGDTRVAAGF